MATTEISWFVRDDSSKLIASKEIAVDDPVSAEYVMHKQMIGSVETILLWDSTEFSDYEMSDCLVAPLGCDAILTVGPTEITIPHGTVIYVIVGGNPDASCSVSDVVQAGSLIDVVVRGTIPEGT